MTDGVQNTKINVLQFHKINNPRPDQNTFFLVCLVADCTNVSSIQAVWIQIWAHHSLLDVYPLSPPFTTISNSLINKDRKAHKLIF